MGELLSTNFFSSSSNVINLNNVECTEEALAEALGPVVKGGVDRREFMRIFAGTAVAGAIVFSPAIVDAQQSRIQAELAAFHNLSKANPSMCCLGVPNLPFGKSVSYGGIVTKPGDMLPDVVKRIFRRQLNVTPKIFPLVSASEYTILLAKNGITQMEIPRGALGDMLPTLKTEIPKLGVRNSDAAHLFEQQLHQQKVG